MLKPKYCEKCGKQLEKEKIETSGKFDKFTGNFKKGKALVIRACPDYEMIYEFNSAYPNGHSQFYD
jgi:hypothetical protein